MSANITTDRGNPSATPLGDESAADVPKQSQISGEASCSYVNPRDVLAQLAICDLIADSCDGSRVLVSGADPSTTDDEIRELFAQFGDVKDIGTQDDGRIRVVSFYDIRTANRVCRQPVGMFILNGKPLSLQYADADHEDDEYDDSTLRVYGIPPVVSNGDMFRLFGLFGDVKDIREAEQEDRSKRCFIVEFFDARNARVAKDSLNNFDLLGSRVTIDSCRSLPLWQRRRHWQQQMLGTQSQAVRQIHQMPRSGTHKPSQSWEQTHANEQNAEFAYARATQFNVAPSSRGTDPGSTTSTGTASSGIFSPQLIETSCDVTFREHALRTGAHNPGPMISPTSFPNVATNSVPILPSMSNYDFQFSPLTQQNMTPPSSYTFEGNRSGGFMPVEVLNNRASSSNNLMQVQPRSGIEMQPRPQFYSPTGFRSISGSLQCAPGSSNGRYYDFNSAPQSSSGAQRRTSSSGSSGRSSGQTSGSFAPRRGPQERQDYYSIVIIGGRVLDSRTTLMIRNIPNKYTQRMLIERLDRENPGCYDFLYLPIDFKNNCNVGYAFVNMVNTDHIPAFYATLHNKRWERFNSEKVCEIAYARIQGLDQLLDHFKNSSLLAEDKKVRPVILLNGRYVPFPDPDVLIRVGSRGPHKFLITDDPEYL